jgi:signal transduction histidine kinase/AmiR/NasT family two-component response regulator
MLKKQTDPMNDMLLLAMKLCNLPVGYLGLTAEVDAALHDIHPHRAAPFADAPWHAAWAVPSSSLPGLGEFVHQILSQAKHHNPEERLVLLPDLAEDAHWQSHPLVQGGEGVRCFIGMFLHNPQDKCIGALALCGTKSHSQAGDAPLWLPILARQMESNLRQASLIAKARADEASLRHHNKLLIQQAKAKDEFMAAMSHELRTPLNTVLGMSEALIDGLFGPLNQSQVNSLQQIVDSGRHLLELVNDILDLAKVEAGEMKLKVEILALEQICESSLRFVRTAALQKRLKLDLEIDPKLSQIQADGLRLRQILVNLLSNAVKFTEKGSITLRVHPAPQEDEVIFSVIDTGVGIPAEYQDRLFQPFMQIENRLDSQHPGTGLGLSLVKRLAELHGGRVTMQSEAGQGSTFSLHLPRTNAHGNSANLPLLPHQQHKPSQEPVQARQPSSDQPAPLILLAEDNQANIDTFHAYLESKGYRILLARNGHEAIKQTLSAKPDLVLMDIQMPEMDGLEAIRQLRGQPDSAHLPILALTSLAMSGDRERCMAAGASDYISKPVSLRQLVERIDILLNRINQEEVRESEARSER